MSVRHVPLLALLALAAFLLRDLLFGGGALSYGDVVWWTAQAEGLRDTLASGSWPLWNRWKSFGQPLAGDPLNQLFYPPTYLHLVLRPWTYLTLFVTAHVLLGAAGAYRIGRRLGLSRGASTLAAGLWTASGPFFSLANMHNQLAGAAWIPWSGWAADRAFAGGRTADAVLWGALLALPILAGSPEAVLSAIAFGVLIGSRHLSAATWKRSAKTLAAAVVFGVTLPAAQLIPSLEMTARSVRSQMPASEKMRWSVPPSLLRQAVTPVFLEPRALAPEVRESLWDGGHPFLLSLYLGLAASGLALAGCRRRTLALVIGFAVCVLVALGRYGPLSAPLALLPVRYPVKAMILGSLLWSLLAGFGLDRLRAALEPRLGRRWVPILIAVVLADPALAHRSLHDTVPRGHYAYEPAGLPVLRGRPALSRVYAYEYPPGPETAVAVGTAMRETGAEPEFMTLRMGLYADVLAQWGVETAYATDKHALFTPDVALLGRFLHERQGTPTFLRLVQMGAVSHVVAYHRAGLEALQELAELETRQQATAKLFAVPDPLPRAYAVDGVRIAGWTDALRVIDDPTFDPRREVILPEGSARPPSADFRGDVQVVSMRGDSVTVEADLSAPGFVVLVDAYYPRWSAEVDGAPAAVQRANVAFRAVAVPAGRHRVEMRYRPRSLVQGLVLSLLAMVAAVLVIRRSRRGAPGAIAPSAASG